MNISVLTPLAIKKLLPQRNMSSHKGENGKVLIIGGSYDYHGAPLLSGLGAFRSGADLVYLMTPECNFEVSRSFLPELIVKRYSGDALTIKSMSLALEIADECDVVLLGSGLGKRKETAEAVVELLSHLSCPIVLDADALLPFSTYKTFRSQKIIMTPHGGELERLMAELLDRDNLERSTQSFAQRHKLNILIKGQNDIIITHDGQIAMNTSGNSGLTSGGTGDVLAGVVAGFLAQKLEPFSAMYLGSYLVGKAGEKLLQQKGYGYIASEVADEVGFVSANLLSD